MKVTIRFINHLFLPFTVNTQELSRHHFSQFMKDTQHTVRFCMSLSKGAWAFIYRPQPTEPLCFGHVGRSFFWFPREIQRHSVIMMFITCSANIKRSSRWIVRWRHAPSLGSQRFRQKTAKETRFQSDFEDFSDRTGEWAQGRQRWMKRGYRHTSRMWCLFSSQVRKRSRPRP